MIPPGVHPLDPRVLPALRADLHNTSVYTVAAFWWLVRTWPGEPRA